MCFVFKMIIPYVSPIRFQALGNLNVVVVVVFKLPVFLARRPLLRQKRLTGI